MEFRVLGPLEVVACDGTVVAVGGSRERAVLVRLLLSANQVVALETLADDLWAGSPPEGAAQALWVYVSRLRKALREHGGGDVLVTRSPGYVLAVDADDVDSARFEGLAGSARELAAAGEPAEAAVQFREALRLWRGRPLAEVADAPFGQAEAARLEEARLAALEGRIDADLACGRHGELVGELAALTRDHPLRERFWAQRMLALYRAGRQAEALRAYQDLRRYLGEELGIDPSEELRRLEGAVLRHVPELDWRRSEPPPGTAEPALADGAPPASPGVVAFVFTDVVGSTELLAELGDDAADDLRRRHFAGLREALSAHGGTEVKSLGDGLMAAFASPAAAVRCALAMQQATAADAGAGGGGEGPGLAVRVGVHAGEPISEGDDFFGTPVVVAQRLCARARGGQILASALVQGLVGNRAGGIFRGLGGLALKGLPDPVAACEVVPATPAEPRRLPLPLPLQRDGATPFVGRDAELARLLEAWEGAGRGRHRLVLVAGDPGIGKTRLGAELARRIHDAGGAVLFGRCAEGIAVPYRPFLEALNGYVAESPEPVLGRLGGELVRLAPELGQRFPDLPPPIRSDPETERYRLFDAVTAWLAEASAQTPALLVVDDLHWATRPTLDLLAHLVRSGAAPRLLVVVTYRDTDLDVTPELADTVAELLRQPGVERLRLPGLDPAGVEAFLAAQARHELDAAGQELANTLHAETGGNPFFVTQMLRHLGETGAVTRRGGRWTAEAAPGRVAVPDSVRDVIARRVARLPDETRHVLAQAAVLGEQFDLAALVHAAGQAEIATLRALDPALTARLITETAGAVPAFRFVHALVRAALYDALPAADRLAFHHGAASAIEAVHASRLDDHLPALAFHSARAGQDRSAEAADYSARAGERALALLAYDEAAAWYRQALDLLDRSGATDQGRRCDLLIALGDAQRRAGDPAHRRTLLDAARVARDLADPDRLARAALANHRGIFGSAAGLVDDQRVEVLEAALRANPTGDTPTRARLLAALAQELMFGLDWPRRVRLSDEALAIARRVGDPATLAQVLLERFHAIWAAGTLAQRAEESLELMALAEQLGDPATEVRAGFLRFRVAMEAGDVADGDRCLEGAERRSAELGQPTLSWQLSLQRTGRVLMAGQIEEADRLVRASYEMGRAAGQPDADAFLVLQQTWIRFEQGRLDEVEQPLAEVVQRMPGLPGLRVFLALLCCELDRPAEARPHFEGLATDDFRGLPIDLLWLMYMALCSMVCTDLGDRPRAEVLTQLLAPYRDQLIHTSAGIVGAVSHHLGHLAATLERHDEAEAHLAHAVETHQRIGAPTWLARTRLEWARMLLRRAGPGDADRARELAGAALATAEELGMARVAAQARETMGA